jgi:hypothetical protein
MGTTKIAVRIAWRRGSGLCPTTECSDGKMIMTTACQEGLGDRGPGLAFEAGVQGEDPTPRVKSKPRPKANRHPFHVRAS